MKSISLSTPISSMMTVVYGATLCIGLLGCGAADSAQTNDTRGRTTEGTISIGDAGIEFQPGTWRAMSVTVNGVDIEKQQADEIAAAQPPENRDNLRRLTEIVRRTCLRTTEAVDAKGDAIGVGTDLLLPALGFNTTQALFKLPDANDPNQRIREISSVPGCTARKREKNQHQMQGAN